MLRIWKCRPIVSVSIICAVFDPDGWVAVQCTAHALLLLLNLFIYYSEIYAHKQALLQLRVTAREFRSITFLFNRSVLLAARLAGALIGPKAVDQFIQRVKRQETTQTLGSCALRPSVRQMHRRPCNAMHLERGSVGGDRLLPDYFIQLGHGRILV